MSDRATFRLPGFDLHPLAERKCHLSLLAAYSRQWNPRNLEFPWYEPWAQIMAALVAEHPSLSVAPQSYLWYDSSPHAQNSTSVPRHLMSTEDEELDEIVDSIGNMTLDSIRSISIPSYRNRARIPDLAITRKVSFPRPDNTSCLSQLSRKVTYVGYPLLVELKPSGARSDDIRKSLHGAHIPIFHARNQLRNQASHLFRMYPHQQYVILIAVSGFWWSYSVRCRAAMDGEGVSSGDREEVDDEVIDFEDPDPSFDDQDGVHSVLKQEPSNLDGATARALQEQLRAYGFALSELECLPGEIRFHTKLPKGQVKLDKSGDWSDLLLYGTIPSNQVFSLILDWLHNVVHYHYWGERG